MALGFHGLASESDSFFIYSSIVFLLEIKVGAFRESQLSHLKDVIRLLISIEAWGEHPKQPSYRSYPRLFSSSFENALNPPANK